MYQDISDFDDSDDMLEKVSHDAKIKQSSCTENVFLPLCPMWILRIPSQGKNKSGSYKK